MQNGTRIGLAVVLGAALAACSDKSEAPPAADSGVSTPTADAGTPDSGPQVAPDSGPTLTPPDAPTLTRPSAQDAVFGRIAVAGRGEAGAQVSAEVFADNASVGVAAAVVDDAGDFELDVAYAGPANGDALRVDVGLANAAGQSPVASVQVVHSAPSTLSGTIEQTGGRVDGTEVYIRAYASNDPADLLSPVAETVVGADDQNIVRSTPFTLGLADGTYYLRAFRDSDGPHSGPDGQPTMGSDAQTPATQVTVVGDTADVNLVLVDRTDTETQYHAFDVRSQHDTAVPYTPAYWTGQEVLRGRGECGGYYMRVRAGTYGNEQRLSPPMVRLPDGRMITMLDDGGCGGSVRDNTSTSYDYEAQDGWLSFGLPEPGADLAGDYSFVYLQTRDDFLHIEVDSVAQVVQLPLLVERISPVGAERNMSLEPTVRWQSAEGAHAYEVRIRSRASGYENDHQNNLVVGTSYTTSPALSDDECYSLQIILFDADPSASDVDAASRGTETFFCTDVDGAQTITVSGSITNQTAATGDVVVHVDTDDQGARTASVRIPAGTNTYSVEVLEGDADDTGGVEAFVDVARSGSEDSPANAAAQYDAGELDHRSSATHDIVFTPPVILGGPQDNATVPSNPTFTWRPYGETAGAAAPAHFVHGVYVGAQGGGFPAAIWGLPPAADRLDTSNLPAATVDVVAFASCMEAGGNYALDAQGGGACSGASATPSRTSFSTGSYGWGVVVLECQWPDFSDVSARGQFLMCLGEKLSGDGLYAASEDRTFTVQ